MWSQRKPTRYLQYFLVALTVGLGVYLLCCLVVVILALLGLWGGDFGFS